jgi:hypothetical protein
MRAKWLVLSSYLGVLSVATLTLVLVVVDADGEGGNVHVSWFLLGGSGIVVLGFLLCWTQQPRAVGRYAARYLSSLDENLTPAEGTRMLRKYSPVLLAASLLYLAGSLYALFFY